MTKATLLAAVAALAWVHQPGAFAFEQEKPGNKQPISFDEFRERCANPQHFIQQSPPTNIVISCRDEHTSWVNGASGEIPLESTRQITTQLNSSKWTVDGQARSVYAQGKLGSCVRFKEVVETFTAERALTCDDINGGKGKGVINLEEFCVQLVNGAKGNKPGKPKGGDLRETGRVIDTCGEHAVRVGKPKGKGDL